MATSWTWEQLVKELPALLQFEREAGQAVRNGFTGWPAWVKTYSEFRNLFNEIPQGHEALQVAHRHLVDVFDQARTAARAPAAVARAPAAVAVAPRPQTRVDVAPARRLQPAPRVPPAQYRPSRKAKW